MSAQGKDAAEKRRAERTALILRGVRRYFASLRWEGVAEFTLTRALRCDLILVSEKSEVAIVEVKSGLEDFRVDQKWPGYQPWCDRFYFAVDADFPIDRVPSAVGLLRADGFDAALLRDAPSDPLPAARRKALIARVAVAAAARLRRFEDPGSAAPGAATPPAPPE